MGTPSTLRLLNRTMVFEAIRAQAPVSRAELARLTSISAPTVSAIVADLLAEGYLRELPDAASDGGRPPRLLVFSEDVAYVGCDLSTSNTVRVGFVNLSDQVTGARSLGYRGESPEPEHVVELLAGEIESWLRDRGGEAQIRGIGVGAPGATDVAAGVVHWAPNLGWREVPLADLISRRLGIPTVVDNDVNLALVGEVNQGVATQAKHAALVSFRDGVGGAVLIDGRLYRGRGDAGEVGYMVTSWPSVTPVHSFGATERSIAQLLADECESRGLDVASLKQETTTLISRLLTDDGELVLRPDTNRELINVISSLLASIAALLDPEVIVLSGWIENLPKDTLVEVEETIDRLVASAPPLRLSELGFTATIAGAGITAHRASTELASVIQAR
jgi:predicted NBD/HSP70 family sugar kinase